jgi:hypothetical protein
METGIPFRVNPKRYQRMRRAAISRIKKGEYRIRMGWLFFPVFSGNKETGSGLNTDGKACPKE